MPIRLEIGPTGKNERIPIGCLDCGEVTKASMELFVESNPIIPCNRCGTAMIPDHPTTEDRGRLHFPPSLN